MTLGKLYEWHGSRPYQRFWMTESNSRLLLSGDIFVYLGIKPNTGGDLLLLDVNGNVGAAAVYDLSDWVEVTS